MAVNFFEQQDTARRKTGVLVSWFSAAVFSTALLIYLVVITTWYYSYGKTVRGLDGEPLSFFNQLWNPQVLLICFTATFAIILAGSIYKVLDLRGGGGKSIALRLGARQIQPATTDFYERRLMNVVEEMAIASGVPVPGVYVLDRENAINAFAAGFKTTDSVIAVTRGTLIGLSRDELQGVIAHEFSHILNGDMGLNLKLMGWLHGLLLIALIGQHILYGAGRSRGNSRNSSSGQIALLALAMIIIGYIGLFFAKMIKAAISRQRERLADAAAVQFTRNPDGLAGALKKIGGSLGGSRLRHPDAETASHMFFSKGTRVSDLLSTHPPLNERIKWLDPDFDGKFTHFNMEETLRKIAETENAPEPPPVPEPQMIAGMAAMGFGAGYQERRKIDVKNPDEILARIGDTEGHRQTAAALLEAIPEKLKTAGRDPYGARALIYTLLLDEDPDIQRKQLESLSRIIPSNVYQETARLTQHASALQPEFRLPLMDLALPALRQMSDEQRTTFLEAVENLIQADGRVSIFELTLKYCLKKHLTAGKPPMISYYATRGVTAEISTVLSVLAASGNDNPAEAQAAFDSAVAELPDPADCYRFSMPETGSWDAFEAALEKLNTANYKVRKYLLAAMLKCLLDDGSVTVEEAELFRAVAVTLDCPVPPWLIATEKTEG